MATIKEIAEIVGVSSAAVSRVLNYDEGISVSDETRDAIFSTAEKLGYKKRVIYPKIENVALLYFTDNKDELEDDFYRGVREEIIKQAIQRSGQVNIYENSEDNKSAIKGRIETIDRIIMKLYNDYAAGTISEDVLNATASKMSDEVAKLKKQLSEIERKQSNGNEITNNYEKFFALVKQYEHIDELTEEIVRTFIERIEIEEKVLPDNKKIAGKNVPYKQKITIHYRFIGNFQENIVNRQDIAS